MKIVQTIFFRFVQFLLVQKHLNRTSMNYLMYRFFIDVNKGNFVLEVNKRFSGPDKIATTFYAISKCFYLLNRISDEFQIFQRNFGFLRSYKPPKLKFLKINVTYIFYLFFIYETSMDVLIKNYSEV
jgi:hypothetical protein